MEEGLAVPIEQFYNSGVVQGCWLSKRACQVLFFELYHHTCYRDNIPEFKEIMKVIREVANGKEG